MHTGGRNHTIEQHACNKCHHKKEHCHHNLEAADSLYSNLSRSRRWFRCLFLMNIHLGRCRYNSREFSLKLILPFAPQVGGNSPDLLSIGVDKKLNLGIAGFIITKGVKEQRPDMVPVLIVGGIISEQVDLGLLLVPVGGRENYPLLLGTIRAD